MHRKHASIVGVPEFLPHYAGLLVKEEIKNLSKAFNPNKPFLFILGGAKFDTKLPLIHKYLEKADTVFVAGALANDLFKQKGYEVGTSLLTEGDFDLENIINNPKLITPVDVMVLKPDGTTEFKSPDSVSSDEYISDVGPKTIEKLKELVGESKTIVWNGPLGKYKKGFKDKTEELARIIASATSENGADSIVGGGDTLASIDVAEFEHGFSFVSTGGGAMLDYLVNETLPGIEALNN
jgi:3-phosphoglycerate kinase